MRKGLAGAVALLVLAGCAGDGGADPLEVARQVRVSPPPGALAVAGDTVWVTAGRRRRHVLVRLDAASGDETARRPLPATPTDLAADDRTVWVVGTDFPDDGRPPQARVAMVDARSARLRRVVRLGVGALSGVALGHGSVWVTDSREDVLYRLDPETGDTVSEISVTGGPTSVATDERWVWVTSPGTGKLHRVDPRTEVPDEFALTGSVPSVVVAGAGGVWVSNYGDEDVVLVHPGTLSVEERLSFDTSASRMALEGEVLAVAEAEGRRLTVLDRAGGDRFALEGRFVVDVALEGGTAWVVDHGAGEVLSVPLGGRISRKTSR